MELKIKESEFQKYSVELKGKLRLKPFLTWAERGHIYNTMLAQDSSFMREYAKVVETAKVCLNVDFEGMTDVEIYDLCAECGLLYEFKIEIDEYMEFDEMIKNQESTYNLISDIVEKLTPMLANADKQTEALKEVLTNANK